MIFNSAGNTKEGYYLITQEVSQRLSILKFWFAVLAVFYHATGSMAGIAMTRNANVDFWFFVLNLSGVLWCVVDGFLFMSALFFYRKPFSWSENIKKKFKTLMIPYFVLNTFWIIFFYTVFKIPSLSSYFQPFNNIPAVDVQNWRFINFINAYIGFLDAYPIAFPLWFLRNLFILNLFAPLFLIIIEKLPKISFALLLILWFFVPSEISSDWVVSFNVDLVYKSVFFWALGCLFAVKKIDLNLLDRLSTLSHCIIYLILVSLKIFTTGKGWISIPIDRACAVYGIIFFYSCTAKIKNLKLKEVLLNLSNYNFDIYIFHEHFSRILLTNCSLLFSLSLPSQLLQYIFVSFLIIIFCILLSIFLRKFFPKFYAILTGGRA